MTDLMDLADEKFVLLTTFRKTGVGVPTPVWIARDADSLVVVTGGEAGKVKRLRHTPRVTLQPCDMRGRVTEGAPVVEGVATVERDAETEATLDRALGAKYGLQYTLMKVPEKLRRRPSDRVLIRITPA